MRYCPRCKIDVFGGSICHACASQLLKKEDRPKIEKEAALSAMPSTKMRLKKDISQSMPLRMGRLAIEILLFCGLFVGVTYAFMHSSNYLADQMESRLPRFKINSNGIRYFWYAGCAIIATLTVKFRFKIYR